MNEILDEEIANDQIFDEDRTSSNLNIRVFIYFLIMISGGMFYTYISIPDNSNFTLIALLIGSISLIIFPMIISFAIDIIKYLLSKRNKKSRKIKRNPLWFSTIEGGFGIWGIFAIILAIGYFASPN